MKAKLLALSLSAIYALFLIGCKEETGDDKAERLGLICINGHVFRETYKSRILGTGTTTLEPLNIACENGKVEVD
ncbi:hypothetical protein [Helicobacter bilis]|uniref:hypothetical protein n=1 Tax=Helicobacter bilis TaxID=37372 RepID=UPI00294231FC|nr:hypothetical protein [Helicobacter bilis]